MINTQEIIGALIDPLLTALASDDFEEEKFAAIQSTAAPCAELQRCPGGMGHFIAWSDFDLWDAWLRVWALGTVNTEFRAMNALADFTATGDQKSLRGEALDPVFF